MATPVLESPAPDAAVKASRSCSTSNAEAFAPEALIDAQRADPSHRKYFYILGNESATFEINNGVLVRRWAPRSVRELNFGAVNQIFVPGAYRNKNLVLAHESPWAGHAGLNKTYELATTTFGLEVERFLGVTSHYRDFCLNFATVAQPLTIFTSPKVVYVWSLECQ